MKRYGRGWYGDSYRHYLAGKGVSTARFTKQNKYFADDEKAGFMDKHKMTAASNIPDSEAATRNAIADRKESEIRELMIAKIDAKDMDSLATGPYWDDFEREKGFMLQSGDVEGFNTNVDRMVVSRLDGQSSRMEIIPSKI